MIVCSSRTNRKIRSKDTTSGMKAAEGVLRVRVTGIQRIAKAVLWTTIGAAVFGFLPVGDQSGRTTGAGSLFEAGQARAQNFAQRTVQGKVVDDTGTVVGGATVFLKDIKTRSIKSFTSTADGTFRFAQVGMVDDYEVWAEHNGRKSPTKTISSF